MRMQKKQFRIGELATKLSVEKFVIRFWEKEFNLKTTRSTGRQRFYTEQDYKTFKQIKELLYSKGYTIAGAKKILSSTSEKITQNIIASQKTTMGERSLSDDVIEQCLIVRQQLKKLQELL